MAKKEKAKANGATIFRIQKPAPPSPFLPMPSGMECHGANTKTLTMKFGQFIQITKLKGVITMTECYCKDKNKDSSFGCKYCRKAPNGDFIGNRGGGRKWVNCCYFLPYWGKPIGQISRCPRYNPNGSENENSLRNVCHVAR